MNYFLVITNSVQCLLNHNSLMHTIINNRIYLYETCNHSIWSNRQHCVGLLCNAFCCWNNTNTTGTYIHKANINYWLSHVFDTSQSLSFAWNRNPSGSDIFYLFIKRPVFSLVVSTLCINKNKPVKIWARLIVEVAKS